MARKNVEAIVPLLPMQRGFLWRSLTNVADTCDLTLHCTLRGNINVPLLERAWQLVVNSHQALRSSIHWEDLSVPVQVVHKDVKTSVKINNDVSSDTETPDQLDLAKAPAHQLTLTLLSTDTCEVKWLLSHVLLDGWSCSLVINDWLRHYSGLVNGHPAPVLPSMTLNHYNQWIRKQDESSIIDFWHKAIPPHVPLATPLPYLDKVLFDPSEKSHSVIRQTIDTNTTEKLLEACKSSGLSINSILQAAFGLVLKPVESVDELVLSSTVSGRQVDVPGIDTFVGMLINVMPVIIKFKPELTIRDWLLEHQAMFFASLPYAHVNLPDLIDARGEITTGAGSQSVNPVNCLLVVENQIIATSSKEVTVSDYHSGIVSEMDLTLLVIPAQSLKVEIRYRNDLLCGSTVKDLLERLSQLLTDLPMLMEKPLSATVAYQVANSDSRLAPALLQYDSIKVDKKYDEQRKYANLQPQPLIEKQLHVIWQQVFGYSVDLDAAFFDIGGNSLQAVRLFSLIEKQMGCVLPATTLFTSPTIRKLAAFILSDQTAGFGQNVVGINTTGSRPPLFIPFEQFDMLLYRHLFTALGADQPIYGLQTSQTPLQDASEIETLIKTITTLHPTGPYLLAGLSGSGLSAWTIASKLESKGHIVAMLGLLDTYGPEYPHLPPPWATLVRIIRQLFREGILFSKAQLVKRLSKDDRQQVSPKPETELTQQLSDQSVFAKRLSEDRKNAVIFAKNVVNSQPLNERLALVTAVRIASFSIRSFGLKMELLLLIQGLLLQYCQCNSINALDKSEEKNNGNRKNGESALQGFLARYESMYGGLELYQGKLVYLAAAQRQAVCLDDPTFGWSKLFPSHADIHETPGAHLNMLNPPNVSSMAEVLRREMALAVEQTPAAPLN